MGYAHPALSRDISSSAMAAKKTVVEVHKFGGASLGDGGPTRFVLRLPPAADQDGQRAA